MNRFETETGMWSDHKRVEERSLALHEEIARRIRTNPELIMTANRNLERWMQRDGEKAVWREWKEILERPLSEIMDFLVSDDENGRRLRQSSPFCGILTPGERWAIYESFTVGTYYSRFREHSG
jgi:hypothetical protein